MAIFPFSFFRLAGALCAFALYVVPAGSLVAGPGPSGYKLAATWKPGGEGRWDYMTLDPTAGRLYIARENRIQVLDTSSGALVGEVPGLDGAHGVALVTGLGRGFATSGRAGTVIAFDLKTLKPIGPPIPAGIKPDAIAYEPQTNRVFAMNGGSDNITVIDAATARVSGTIPLPGAPEFAVSDWVGHLFVNIEDKSETVEIDAQAMKVAQIWPLAPGERPTGLSIDRSGNHLFAGCANKTLVVLDDMTGKVLAALPIGAHVDATRFDDGYAFSSNGDGTLTVVAADASGQFKVIDTVPTKLGARTMAVDPTTHAVYVCTADFGPPDPASHGRPQPLPGTFVVLKFTR
jgi:YVTN family beta-propeller protein